MSQEAAPANRSPDQRILDALSGVTDGLTRRELRDTCRLRNATLGEVLTTLQSEGRVRVEGGRVQLALL
jgi:DNA-binding IclR family transcriptional regulator